MKPGENSTVIGKSVTIRGEISGSEDLYLDGDIQGTVTLPANLLTIGPNAHVLADLQVRDITVYGRVEGNIRATGRVDLRQTASLLGDIHAARLSIEEKAVITGRVEVASPAPASPARHATTSQFTPTPDHPMTAPAEPSASLFGQTKA